MLPLRTYAYRASLTAALCACFATVAAGDQPPVLTPAQADRREAESLESPAWRQTLRAWSDWLAANQSYSPEEAERLRQELDLQLSEMSGAQLADFKGELDAKLALLKSDSGRQYLVWQNETLKAASDAYRRKLRAELPDLARMSASEVQGVLDHFAFERQRVQESEAAYHRSQERRVALAREELRRQQEATERGLDRAGRDANLRAHFAAPPQQQANVRQYGRQYGYGFPFFWFFWW